MAGLRTQVASFATGIVVVAASLTPAAAPFSDVLLVGGTGVASLGYGLVVASWMEKRGPTKPKITQPPVTSEEPPMVAPVPSASEPISPPANTASQAFSAPATPSVQTPAAQVTSPAVEPPSPSPDRSVASASPPTPGTSASPSMPPPSNQLKPPTQRKIPSVKIPKVSIPTPINEHKVPIALVAVGTGLVIGALATISPQAGLFGGLFIPGILLLGVGSVILFLQLYRRPPGLRRFCMNCGFQMLTTDVACGRCHKQPPSGVDTKVCPNDGAVIPASARFCKDCGAGQPS